MSPPFTLLLLVPLLIICSPSLGHGQQLDEWNLCESFIDPRGRNAPGRDIACPPGYRCTFKDGWYHQCRPSVANAPEPTRYLPGPVRQPKSTPTVPVAQLRSNFGPGLWNSFGKGLNLQCVPLSSNLPSVKALDQPLAYLNVITSPIFAGEVGRFDAPIMFHIYGAMKLAMYNAYSAYDAVAVPSYSTGVPRQPRSERTEKNINTAMFYAGLRAFEAAMPKDLQQGIRTIKDFMIANGLDPEDKGTDLKTAVGVGNIVGAIAVRRLEADGFNSLGDIDHQLQRRPYSDYSGYNPINTAYQLSYPSRWQPLLETDNYGYFFVQQLIAAQSAQAKPELISAKDMQENPLQPPYSMPLNMQFYKAQAKEVLDVNAALTDRQKMLAEYFEDKFTSFIPLTLSIAKAARLSPARTTAAVLLHNVCSRDVFIASWKEKVRHDAVRPISAIRNLYAGQRIQASVQNLGKQTIKGEEWLSYLRTLPHPDFPSATSCYCAAYAEFMKELIGTKQWINPGPLIFKKGCSRREPGLTPAQDLTIEFSSWDELVYECGQSRLYAGVHFQVAIDAGIKLCAPLGRKCGIRANQLLSAETPYGSSVGDPPSPYTGASIGGSWHERGPGGLPVIEDVWIPTGWKEDNGAKPTREEGGWPGPARHPGPSGGLWLEDNWASESEDKHWIPLDQYQ